MNKFFLLWTISLLLWSCNNDQDPDDLTNLNYTPSEAYPLIIPKEFPALPEFPDNPMTKAGVLLGRHLFYDPILSLDSSISCSSCHQPALGFSDGRTFSPGVGGTIGNRNSMSLINVAYYTNGLFWDGRAKDLADQAKQPVENPVEMHENWSHVEEKLRRSTFYPGLFRNAFGIGNKKEITKDLASKAIAQFERLIIAGGNSKYAKSLRGETSLTVDEEDGKSMYLNNDPRLPDAQCGHCHAPPLFQSNNYFNNGLDSVSSLNQFTDKGRGAISNNSLDLGRFRATSLINIHLSAPYMHDGRLSSLDAVMEHYTKQVKIAPNLDPNVANLKISDRQAKQVLAFIKTLIDTSYLQNPDIFSPF